MKEENTRILTEIAHLYYDHDWTQEAIADKFNISRSLVSKYLTKAKKMGIIEIIIHDADLHPHHELESMLKEKFHLKDALCLDAENLHNKSKKSFYKTIGKFLSYKIIKANKVIMSGGSSNYEISSNFTTSTPYRHVTFIPASGGLYQEAWAVQANSVCERMANNCGGNYLQLPAPIIVDSEEAKTILMRQRFIKDVFNQAKQADLAIVGIGVSPTYHELAEVYLNELDHNRKELKEKPIGDILYNYYDKSGNVIDCEWNKKLLSLTLDDLKNIPEVVGVAIDKEKTASVYTALKYSFVNSLITDIKIAKELLKM